MTRQTRHRANLLKHDTARGIEARQRRTIQDTKTGALVLRCPNAISLAERGNNLRLDRFITVSSEPVLNLFKADTGSPALRPRRGLRRGSQISEQLVQHVHQRLHAIDHRRANITRAQTLLINQRHHRRHTQRILHPLSFLQTTVARALKMNNRVRAVIDHVFDSHTALRGALIIALHRVHHTPRHRIMPRSHTPRRLSRQKRGVPIMPNNHVGRPQRQSVSNQGANLLRHKGIIPIPFSNLVFLLTRNATLHT